MENKELQERFDAFWKSCNDKLSIAQRIRQDYAKYRTLEQNKIFFKEMAEDYEHNFSNAEYLHELGFPDVDLLSVIYRVFDRSLRNVMLNRPIFVWNKSDLLLALSVFFKDLDRNKLQSAFDKQCCLTQIQVEDSRMLESSTIINGFNRTLESANGMEFDWMAGYGVYISPLEQDMCKFWYSLSELTLDRIATHIVDAFFHGFISQSRSIDNRTNVRLMYAIGQEALAQRVVELFRNRGFEPIILQPSSSAYSEQCIEDHKYDFSAYIISTCYEGQSSAYSLATERYRDYIQNTCGFIRIGTFGKRTNMVASGTNAYKPGAQTLKLYGEMLAKNRSIEAGILKPDRLSFCSIVFPDKRVGKDFKAIFDSFYKLNTEESKPYELIQNELIDILDKCDSVRLVGMNGNRTDMTVNMMQLKDKTSQTKFLNCGGDINVPHGEMFTTPLLTGTDGILNVNEIYLRGKFYKNLTLTFKDGHVTDYSCNNFEDSEENRRYIFENLLNNTENAPIGELSIGTNTLAYKTAQEYSLFSCLPILLAEKMGPHIAIGDPCFARGEDSAVYNIYDGKEMVARENEITANRAQNPDCYVNFHTDITIPFNEMGLFAGVNLKTGEEHIIIKNGRFVPEAAHKLNENLE
ncbi:MAG: aminopeptidase [Clostridiales bacterium]|nr:aminopeptidase [Clostridiales bacterium]